MTTRRLRLNQARTDVPFGWSINELVMLNLDAGRGLWHTIRSLPAQRNTPRVWVLLTDSGCRASCDVTVLHIPRTRDK
jgi:hypothetical protein